MDMQPIESSHIHSIGHDPATSTMHVRFKSGSTYAYKDVTPEEHQRIVGAGSVGSALKIHTAGKAYNKVGG